MTNNIISSFEIFWNSRGGSEVCLDEVVSSPNARAAGDVSDQTSLGDLAPLERTRGKYIAFACAMIRRDKSPSIETAYHYRAQYN